MAKRKRMMDNGTEVTFTEITKKMVLHAKDCSVNPVRGKDDTYVYSSKKLGAEFVRTLEGKSWVDSEVRKRKSWR